MERSPAAATLAARRLVCLLIWCQFLLATAVGWPFSSERNETVKVTDRLLHLVEPFDDKMLPKSQLAGENVPGLGNLMMLNTLMSANSVQSTRTSFSIHTRSRSMTGVKFIPLAERSSFWSKFTFGSQMQLTDLQVPHYQYDIKRLIDFKFNATKKTVVVIPGYRTGENTAWMEEIVESWLTLYGDQVQVITVSWSDANQGIYSTAVANTILVARQLTIFLYYLLKTSSASSSNSDADDPYDDEIVDKWNDQEALDNIHLIGHSCGAHIAGFVGQDLGGKVGRITGLDPAGPSFDKFPRTQRLDRTDAKLVEVLHTNSGKLRYIKALASTPKMAFNSFWSDAPVADGLVKSGIATGGPMSDPNFKAWFGINLQVGHIDYYANDGSNQPGCRNDMQFCEHHRAVHIYIDLLRYEIAVRLQSGVNHQNEGNNGFGLLAYKASNYNSFETGESFGQECGDLLSASHKHLNKLHQDEALRHCAVPLFDVRRPVNELISELKHRFGVKFNELAHGEQQPKYYFKTSAGEFSTGSPNRLIGDHYLLRIYLADGGENFLDNELQFRWREPSCRTDNWCTLKTQLIMDSGDLLQMETGHLRRSQVALVEGGARKQSMIAIPFVHPAGSLARLQLESLLSMRAEDVADMNLEDRWASAAFSAGLRRLAPKSIVLALSEKEAASECGACQLVIKALEVQPLDGRQGIGVLYGPRLSLEERVPIMSGAELVRLLAESPGEHKMASLTRLKTCPDCGMKSYAVGLEAVLSEK